MPSNPSNPDPIRDALSLLRGRELPDAPPWFAAATLARLRQEGRLVRPGLAGAWGEFMVRLAALFPEGAARRWLPAGAALALVTVGLSGWHLQRQREARQLTYAALELVAQGEDSPFQESSLDEGDTPTWNDVSF